MNLGERVEKWEELEGERGGSNREAMLMYILHTLDFYIYHWNNMKTVPLGEVWPLTSAQLWLQLANPSPSCLPFLIGKEVM